MAVMSDPTLKSSNSTTALFRAWITFIDAALLAGGWVNPGDTGQLSIVAAAIPTVANQQKGFRIYRMADALQATSPVFLRIDYGSGSATLNPGIWITIGTGTNGAGVITGVKFTYASAITPTTATAGTTGADASATHHSFASADTNRFQLALTNLASGSGYNTLFFSLERSRDATGALTGDGLIMIWTSVADPINNASVNAQLYIALTGTQPPAEFGLNYVLSGQNPSAFGSDIGIGIPIPMKGVAQPPGIGVMIVKTLDFVAEAQFSVTTYGVAHNYIQLPAMSVSRVNGPTSVTLDSYSVACLLYE